jgi:hypothetical protein
MIAMENGLFEETISSSEQGAKQTSIDDSTHLTLRKAFCQKYFYCQKWILKIHQVRPKQIDKTIFRKKS